jgi:hypothetical protein
MVIVPVVILMSVDLRDLVVMYILVYISQILLYQLKSSRACRNPGTTDGAC